MWNPVRIRRFGVFLAVLLISGCDEDTRDARKEVSVAQKAAPSAPSVYLNQFPRPDQKGLYILGPDERCGAQELRLKRGQKRELAYRLFNGFDRPVFVSAVVKLVAYDGMDTKGKKFLGLHRCESVLTRHEYVLLEGTSATGAYEEYQAGQVVAFRDDSFTMVHLPNDEDGSWLPNDGDIKSAEVKVLFDVSYHLMGSDAVHHWIETDTLKLAADVP